MSAESPLNDDDRELLHTRLCQARDALDEVVYLYSSDAYLVQTAAAEVEFYEKMRDVYADLSSASLEHGSSYDRLIERLRQASLALGDRPTAND